eukprot:COSAG01_NODE_28808_length_652_cov_1.027125_1_plen_143_part_00
MAIPSGLSVSSASGMVSSSVMSGQLSVGAAARQFDKDRVFAPRPCGCDLYHLIGLDGEESNVAASPAEVDFALRVAKLACHPDKNGGTAAATQGFARLMVADDHVRQAHAVPEGNGPQNRLDIDKRRAYNFHYIGSSSMDRE